MPVCLQLMRPDVNSAYLKCCHGEEKYLNGIISVFFCVLSWPIWVSSLEFALINVRSWIALFGVGKVYVGLPGADLDQL